MYVDECPLLSSPEYGHIVSITGNTINDTVVVKCFDSFILIGSAVRRCQPNGQWSGTDTACVGKLMIIATSDVNEYTTHHIYPYWKNS